MNDNYFIESMLIAFIFYTIFFYYMTKYYCPRCKSRDIIEYKNSIECPKCKLEFDKELFGVVDDENMLARQEVRGFLNSFEDEDEF